MWMDGCGNGIWNRYTGGVWCKKEIRGAGSNHHQRKKRTVT
jgi:hypothetical protein